MASKVGTAALTLSIFFAACSSKPKPAPNPSPETIEDAPPPPAEIGAENLPPTDEPIAAPSPTLKDVQIGVYIDSIGYDGLAALGFMQELEKGGLKPVRLAGTGFGCWIAVSWAIEGSGNRAEWQSFKWTRWDLLPQRGLLNRLKGALGGDERFFTEVARHFKVTRFNELQVPADCPLVANQSNYPLETARNSQIREAFWWQLLHPALGVPEGTLEDEKHLSGAFLGFPRDNEWDRLSADTGAGGSAPAFWIYLKTYRSGERRQGVANSTLLGLRSDPPTALVRRTPEGNYWMQIDISQAGGKRVVENLSDPGWRRRFLLEGRKRGRQIIESKLIEARFGELFAPVVTPEAPAGN